MEEPVNIKYYFYCRHKLGVKVTQIGNEINSLFRIKIPVREGLINWADCIDTDHSNNKLFQFDSNDKKCFKYLEFELKSFESTCETLKIQFYALCRYQLSKDIAAVLDELEILFDNKAPSIITFHAWLLSCRKKNLIPNESNSSDSDAELIDLTSDNDKYVEIDLTSEIEENEIVNEIYQTGLNDSSLNKRKRPDENDQIISYYIWCRKKLGTKKFDLIQELNELFNYKYISDEIEIYDVDYDELEIEIDSSCELIKQLNIQLDLNESRTKQCCQFYAICRNKLNTNQNDILFEIEVLFGENAIKITELKNILKHNQKNKSEFGFLAKRLEEKDAIIDQLKEEINCKTRKFEHNLLNKQLEINDKDAQIEQLREEIKKEQSLNKSICMRKENLQNRLRNSYDHVRRLVNQLNDCKSKLKASDLNESVESLKKEINRLKLALDESYEFLIEKETSFNKLLSDLESFELSLNMILNNGSVNIRNDNHILFSCLAKIKSHLESVNVRKIIRVVDSNNLKPVNFLPQLKMITNRINNNLINSQK